MIFNLWQRLRGLWRAEFFSPKDFIWRAVLISALFLIVHLLGLRDYTSENGQTNRIVTTTMGAAVDLENQGLRRLLVNACYWAVGLEKRLPASANVDYVGEYQPGWFGFGKFKPGLKPADLELKR